ncbi:MAG: hypothetical protein AMXMBFR64_30920 [Myxococcales bacterium]
MSHTALQRALVRMLYDPALVAAVYADPSCLGLGPEEQRWLTAQDPRAYATDPHRRGRTLAALIEELPAASALAARAGGASALDAFFSSARFHGCIETRGSLAEAYAEHLAGLTGRERRLAPVASLEGAIARARRARPSARGAGLLVTAPGVVALRLCGGTLALRQAVIAALSAHEDGLVAAVVDRSLRLPARRLDPATPEELLVERAADGGIGVSEGSAALGELLRACASPVPRDVALAEARRHGLEPGEDAEVVDGLITDGLLLEVSP